MSEHVYMVPLQEERNIVVPISVMIFTLDEEIHIESCITSVSWSDDVIVVDSGSRDKTVEIARQCDARIYTHPFKGFGSQRNWALDNCDTKYEWVLVLDADETVPGALAQEMAENIGSAADEIGAYRIARRFYMWGKWLRYSSLYPTYVVRLIRKGRVRYINRGHAETQTVDGEVGVLRNDLIDENKKSLSEWFDRQNRYSSKDAKYELEAEDRNIRIVDLVCPEPLKRRAALKKYFRNVPLRPTIFFLYSYFIRRGFLDGKEGLMFCRMKAVYQTMLLAKKFDLQKKR